MLGVLVALLPAFNRHKIETRNRRVETAVDYVDAYNLAIASKIPFSATLDALKQSGITSLAVAEDTFDSLRLMGAMTVMGVSPTETDLTFSREFPGQMERVTSALQNKTSLAFHVSGDTVIVSAPYNEISSIGAGLNPVEVNNTINAGLYVCPRIYNYPGVTTRSIVWMINRVHEQCDRSLAGGQVKEYANVVIFDGADVLGNRDHIDDTAMALAQAGLHYGSIEFGKQIGDEDLSIKAEDLMVRVHSIAGNEMPTMDEPTAVGRFILGARERNIRLIYIRMFQNGMKPAPNIAALPPNLSSLPDPLLSNVAFLWEVREGLKEGGLTIGRAHGFRADPIPSRGLWRRILLALMSLGAAAAGVLLVRRFTGLTDRGFWQLFWVSLVIGIVLTIPQHTLIGRQILALIAAIALPSLGLMSLRLPRRGPGIKNAFWAVEHALRQYAIASAWTVLGIILVIGLLADRAFMLHIDEFAGIRLAIIAPMFLTVIYHGLGLGDLAWDATWEERSVRLGERWREFTLSPLLMGQTLAGIVGLAIVGMIVLRSGNDPGVGVSGAEMSLRGLLNKILFVRPRTKEFLFGHPLMVAGLASAFAGKRKWLNLFLAAGAIGQASLLNTFCHIHTPLLFSLVRGLLGWLLGAFIGIVLFLIARRFWGPDAADQ